MRLAGIFAAAALFAAATTTAAAAQAPAASTAAEAAQGKILVRTCVFCHGISEYTVPYPTRHVPYIGGQHDAYLISALNEYAANNRNFATMHAQAASLTSAQIRDIAAYLSSLGPKLPATAASASAPGDAPAQVATCAACHGPRGISTTPQFPMLAGQHADYLLQALKDYKSGARKNAIMNGMAAGLSLAQMKALADYFSRQHGPLVLIPHAGPD